MAPRATTGIVLREFYRDGRFELERPNQPVIVGTPNDTPESMRGRAGLADGYWLRAERQLGTGGHQAWTWVQL